MDMTSYSAITCRQALERLERHARLAAFRMLDCGRGDTVMVPYDTACGDALALDMLDGNVAITFVMYGTDTSDLTIGDGRDDAYAELDGMLAALAMALCGVGTIATRHRTDEDNADGAGDWIWTENGAHSTVRYGTLERCVARVGERIDTGMSQLVPCRLGVRNGRRVGYAETDGKQTRLPDDVARAAWALRRCGDALGDAIMLDRDETCALLADIAGILR